MTAEEVTLLRMKPLVRLACVASVIAVAAQAGAAEIDTGNDDIAMRWDNTLRYTAGWRVGDPDSRILDNPSSDESDSKFDRGDMVTNRADLLSEFDFVYRRDYGFRASATAWYDQAYHDEAVRQNPALAAGGVPSSYAYDGNRYSSYTSRYYKGASGELLDAFVFANLQLGETPLRMKLGQHTVYYGQALYYLGGISYSQAGMDLRKAAATPGSEVKELFLPVNQLSLQAQFTPQLSLAAQYFLDWKPYRAPEGGTYLSGVDFTLAGPTNTGIVNPAAPGFELLPRSDATGPEHQSGNWGVNLRWQPESLGGASLAASYRRLDEKLPWLFIAADGSNYHAVYPRKTEIIGLSTDFPLGVTSIGAELALRRNAALLSPSFVAEPEGARGDVLHVAVNTIYVLPKTPLWQTGALSAEVYGSHLLRVTDNEALFQQEGRAACTNPLTGAAGSGNKDDGCATRTAVGIGFGLTPQWLAVRPGLDLSLPISGSYQLSGNESDMAAGAYNEGNFSYAVGLEADVYRRFKATLAYYGYGGNISREAGGAWASINGQSALLQDRDWLGLTVKTTF